MGKVLNALFEPSGLTPHGFCLLWEPGLIWLHAASDLLIGLAYYSIPLALVYFVRRRRDVAFGWVFWLFAAFILACGTTHFISILTLWQPAYWLEGVIKLATALLSVATAVLLWPLLPRALALPSPEILRRVNLELAQEIAKRDQAQAALRVSEARLRQAQKMETIGQLTGGMAHDFNNLLTVMMGGMEMIGVHLAKLPAAVDVSRIAKSRDLAMQAVRRAAMLTERLLAFARQQPLEPKPIAANHLIVEMMEILGRSLGETIELKTDFASDLWLIKTDPNQLENALMNLSLNARDAMPDGGTLTIRTENGKLSAADVKDLTETISPGEYVVITVADTGVGMSAAALEQAFEPFFTTKDVGKGTGLGLSQVYGFVRQSDGHVRLESEPGRGTTARIFLPRLLGAPDQAPAPHPPVSQVCAAGHSTILVVEDHDAVRIYSTEILTELGHRVVHAANAQDALAALDREPSLDLLFTDIVLPGGMNGRQLADEVKRRRPEIKVLFTTGYSRDAIMDDGQVEDGVAVITKPFTFADLSQKLQAILNG
jgi:signal transduction histidine kinase